MIGDRRLMNLGERSLSGPSKYLPGGYMMTSIHCPRGSTYTALLQTERIFIIRQEWQGPGRSQMLCHSHMMLGFLKVMRLSTDFETTSMPVDSTQVFPSFKSLYQGDHLGVEFALSSHSAMLSGWGILRGPNRILGHHPFPLGPDYEGLVIDDYFALTCQPLTCPDEPCCLGFLKTATAAYDKERVLGSPEKDVVGSQHFSVVGAEIDSSQATRSRGAVLVAASLAKRLSLVSLSLSVAALPMISRSLASRLSGTLDFCAHVSSVSGLCFGWDLQAWRGRWKEGWWGPGATQTDCWGVGSGFHPVFCCKLKRTSPLLQPGLCNRCFLEERCCRFPGCWSWGGQSKMVGWWQARCIHEAWQPFQSCSPWAWLWFWGHQQSRGWFGRGVVCSSKEGCEARVLLWFLWDMRWIRGGLSRGGQTWFECNASDRIVGLGAFWPWQSQSLGVAVLYASDWEAEVCDVWTTMSDVEPCSSPCCQELQAAPWFQQEMQKDLVW